MLKHQRTQGDGLPNQTTFQDSIFRDLNIESGCKLSKLLLIYYLDIKKIYKNNEIVLRIQKFVLRVSKKRIYYLTKNISISFNHIYFFYVRTLNYIITLKINLLEYVAVNLNSMVIVNRLDRMLNAGYETRFLKIILMLLPRYIWKLSFVTLSALVKNIVQRKLPGINDLSYCTQLGSDLSVLAA